MFWLPWISFFEQEVQRWKSDWGKRRKVKSSHVFTFALWKIGCFSWFSGSFHSQIKEKKKSENFVSKESKDCNKFVGYVLPLQEYPCFPIRFNGRLHTEHEGMLNKQKKQY